MTNIKTKRDKNNFYLKPRKINNCDAEKSRHYRESLTPLIGRHIQIRVYEYFGQEYTYHGKACFRIFIKDAVITHVPKNVNNNLHGITFDHMWIIVDKSWYNRHKKFGFPRTKLAVQGFVYEYTNSKHEVNIGLSPTYVSVEEY